ncbi:MAG: hypothetical protein COB38_11275, partial [Gammaproteobacteria bacterium]
VDKLKKYITERIGDSKDDIKILRFNSPLFRVKEIKTPILIIAGRKDRVVPYRQSGKMIKALRKAKKEYENLDLEYAPHNIFRYIDEKEKVLNKIEGFLAKYLNS